MMLKFNTARAAAASPEDILRQAFADRMDAGGQLSAVFTDSKCIGAVGVAGLPLRLPAIQELLKLPEVATLLPKEAGASALFTVNDTGTALSLHIRHAGRQEQTTAIPEAAASAALAQLQAAPGWAGALNAEGEHVIDLRSPVPGAALRGQSAAGQPSGVPSSASDYTEERGRPPGRRQLPFPCGYPGAGDPLGYAPGGERLPGQPSILSV
ncbi:hypothetical protein ACFTAO_35935 [Paenibacillus rhizoplanae]